jgi:hypothetical protein
MRDALRHFSGPEEAGSVASAGTQPVIDEMQRTVLDLHSLGERSYSRVSQIAAAGAQLVAEIDALRGGFPAGPLFARVAEHARVELDRIAATAAAPARDHAGAAQSSEFESLAGRYTMQMERDVHASLTCTAAPAQAPAASAGTTLGDGDFGDNVELF